jgi:hypothetical protein
MAFIRASFGKSFAHVRRMASTADATGATLSAVPHHLGAAERMSDEHDVLKSELLDHCSRRTPWVCRDPSPDRRGSFRRLLE